MTINVRGKNIDITPAIRDHVEKRVSKIDKYFDASGDITAILTVEKGRHIAEVTVPVNGMLLRGEESTSDMYASVDMVVKKLEKQIEKYRTKLSRRVTFKHEADLAPSAPPAGAELQDEEATGDFKIVKTKRFAIKPMSVQEAVLQMNLLYHDFYVFANAETEDVNVIYRRKDGKYGLIEPEF
ncbi:MAG: ribosome-associated translation inhibitor RaiA [Sporomusaceae bacterium]|jgi:putative sigma-54 modulation protein|nr:ribosome-associated translation inhibitor RaiA [Sporomusaceae bacterium]